MNPSNASLVAVAATASLMLVNRGVRRFQLSFETKLWFLMAWALIFLAVTLVARATAI